MCVKDTNSAVFGFPSRELKRRDYLFLPDPPTLWNGYSTATGVGRFPPGAPRTSRFQSFNNVGGYAASLSPRIQNPGRHTAQSPVTWRSHQKCLERLRRLAAIHFQCKLASMSGRRCERRVVSFMNFLSFMSFMSVVSFES